MSIEGYLNSIAAPVVEPRAEFRQAAATYFEAYSAYLAAGFSQVEAMTLLVNLIAMGQR